MPNRYETKYFIRVEIKTNNENKEFKEEGYLPRRLAEDPPLDLITPVEKSGKNKVVFSSMATLKRKDEENNSQPSTVFS